MAEYAVPCCSAQLEQQGVVFDFLYTIESVEYFTLTAFKNTTNYIFRK